MYFGTGMETGFNHTSSFYKFSIEDQTWSSVPDLPSDARQYSAACNCGAYGIVIGGINAQGDELDDIWLYNEAYNSWNMIAQIPDGGRQKLIAQCYYQNIIIGWGHANGETLHSFWRYNIPTGVWYPYAPCPLKRENGISFIAKDTLYVALGNDNTEYHHRLFALDLTRNIWKEKASFPDMGRIGSIGVNLGEKGFVGLGMDSAQNFYADFYVYEPSEDTWTKSVISIEDSLRGAKVAVIGNQALISTGLNHTFRSYKSWLITDDTYQFSHSGLSNNHIDFEDAPTGEYDLTVYDMQGRLLRNWTGIYLNQDHYLPLNTVGDGMYIIHLKGRSNDFEYTGKTAILSQH